MAHPAGIKLWRSWLCVYDSSPDFREENLRSPGNQGQSQAQKSRNQSRSLQYKTLRRQRRPSSSVCSMAISRRNFTFSVTWMWLTESQTEVKLESETEGYERPAGGHIRRADVPGDVKHPVIIPRKGHLTELFIKHHHLKEHHMGRGMTHNEFISSCVTCRWLRRPAEQQKMAWFPEDRLEPASPFSYCAVDYFGPFIVKERRSQVKRYGVLFTCMGSRSVHLETANSPDSSSFINALGRFMSRRGALGNWGLTRELILSAHKMS